MSISAVSGNMFSLSSLSQSSSATYSSATIGLDDASSSAPPRHHRGGGFRNAIENVLSALDLNASTATSASTSLDSTASSSDVNAALNAFTQSLMSALHAQQSGTQSTDGSSQTDALNSLDSTQALAAAANTPPPPPPCGAGKFQSDLDALIQELSASDGSSASGSSTDATTAGAATASSGSSTGSSVDASLETSFQNLLNALGQGNSNVSLNDVLTKLANGAAGGRPAGNFVDTTA